MKILIINLLLIVVCSSLFAQDSDPELNNYTGQSEIRGLKSITLKDGFHIPAGSTVRLWVGGIPNLFSAPSANQNYILTRTFRTPVKESELANVRNIAEENQQVQYFDGLGRPMQTVELMASPNYKDIVQPITYDIYGREHQKHLPYAEQHSNNGSFKSAGLSNQKSFYAVGGGWDPSVMRTGSPFGETIFENSPLNRVLQQGSPGDAWQPSALRGTTGRTLVIDYGTNSAQEVLLWTVVTNGANGSGHYLAGKLYKTTVKDENWIESFGKAGTVDEFKNFEDRVVLKRVWETDSKALDTYYIYDDFGDLRYVVPPGYMADVVTDNETNFNEQVYAYRYDGRRRLIEKKVPGKGWEYIIYNRNDQPILTQDANQRSVGEWLFTKYDAHGRIALTGIYKHADNVLISRDALQTIALSHNTAVNRDWENPTTDPASDGYTKEVFPTTYTAYHIINHYDRYDFPGNSFGGPSSAQAQGIQTKGLLTGTKVTMLGTSTMLLTVNYYDLYARLVGVKQQNHLGGIDDITNEYSFVGELEKSTRVHTAYGHRTTIVTENTYDHVGRLLSSTQQIDEQDKVMLAQYAYNEIGQVRQKSIGGDGQGNNFHDQISYVYNPRGWLLNSSSATFSQQLLYNDPTAGALAQYNGNIAEQHWTQQGHAGKHFTYRYDRLNRLEEGNSQNGGMREELSYDDRGNITRLTRDNSTSLNYSYIGNRLDMLSGSGINATYSYDGNGNTILDRLGMNFSYNHLNLPQSASKEGQSVSYLYNAMGTKLRRTSSQQGSREYVGGIEYVGSNIELIHTGEGVAHRNNNGSYTYRYNQMDHLGNVRATIYRNPTTQAIEVLQQDDYYPFGKQRSILAGSITNKYLYNSKEKQEELGGQYDYGARFYDPVIGRWNVVDPMAEGYFSSSPYNYVDGNPITRIDPDGRSWFTKYMDENGKVLLDTKDGSNDVITIPNSMKKEFLSSVAYTPDEMLNGSGGWNSAWKAEILGEERFEFLESNQFSSQWARQAAINYFQKPTTLNFGKLSLTESLSQWTRPELVVSALSIGAAGVLNNAAKGGKRILNTVNTGQRTGSAAYKSLNVDDAQHFFSNIVDNYASQATKFGLKGGDEVTRNLYQIHGSLRGQSGIFEWIVDGANVTHRRFIPGGVVNGLPNQIVR